MSASVRLPRTAGLYYLLVGVFDGVAQSVRLSGGRCAVSVGLAPDGSSNTWRSRE